jgi:putative transposase
MQVGRRFRLYPNAEQESVLRRWIGAQRFVYNAKIDEYRYEAWLRNRAILSPSWTDPDPKNISLFNQAYSHFRKNNPWMKEVPSQIFRNGCYRYAKAVLAASQGGGAPVIKNRGGRQSLVLTQELFTIQDGCLRIGSRKQDLGFVRWKAHREFETPNMLVVSVEADGRWFAGFSYDDGIEAPKLPAHIENEGHVLGVDLGVARSVTTSEGVVIHPTPEATRSYFQCEKKARRLQRKMARQRKRSHRREKTRKRIARLKAKQRRIRRDFAHKASHALCHTPHKAIAFENLRLSDMTAAPEPRPKEDGKGYERNGAAAKAGLNASLLRWGLGLIRQYAAYKAPRRGKYFVLVSAAYSSQECSHCHHVNPLNRRSQAEFVCQACGTTLNADHNGAIIIAQRGYKILSAGNRQTALVERPKVAMKREAPCVSRG